MVEREITAARILEDNARSFGLDLTKSFQFSATKIADLLITTYPTAKTFTIVCGNGNNGADGLSVALELTDRGFEVFVFLMSRSQKLETDTAKVFWEIVVSTSKKNRKLSYVQEADVSLIPSADVIIEALLGTGYLGRVSKKFRDAVTRIHHLKKPVVALDIQAPGYTPDLTISIGYPKIKDCAVVDMSLPSELTTLVGIGEVNALQPIKKGPYKKQNGKMLVITDRFLEAIPKKVTQYLFELYVCNIQSSGKDESQKDRQSSKMEDYTFVTLDDLESHLPIVDSVCFLLHDTKDITIKAIFQYILLKYPNLKYVFSTESYKLLGVDGIACLIGEVIVITSRTDMQINVANDMVSSKRVFINMLGSQNLLFGYNPFTEKVEMRINPSSLNYFDKGVLEELTLLTSAYLARNHAWLALAGGSVSTSIT